MRKVWDWKIFLAILAIGAISLLVIFSLNKSLFQNQLFFWILGIGVLWFFSYFDYKAWPKISPAFYIFTLFLLIVLFVFGEATRGSVRWFDIGPFRLQPSEMSKAATVLLLASFFKDRDGSKIINVFLGFLLISPALVLILAQPDLGNALAFIAMWIGISISAGFRIKDLVAVAVLGLLLSVLLFQVLAPYQKDRILTFFDPARDPLGTGYHIIQSKIAVGSGQFLGKGLGNSTQSQLKFLPEAESDFIFAATSEQLGFLGAGLLISLFSFLLLQILNLASKFESYTRHILIGIFSFLSLQFLVNVGMNLGLLPVTGITLPLASYGGSSLITTLFLLSFVFSIKRFNI